jgi:hypothetical protein
MSNMRRSSKAKEQIKWACPKPIHEILAKGTPSHTECSDSVRSRGCYSRSLESVCALIVVTHVVLLALMFGALHVAFRNILGVEALLFSWALGCCSTAGLGCCSAVATLLGWPLTADTCHFWASRHCWAVTAHCGHRCGHRRCETGSNSLHQFVSRVRKASVLEVCTIKTVLFQT